MLTRIAVHEPATDGGKGLSLLISIPTLPDIEKQGAGSEPYDTSVVCILASIPSEISVWKPHK
jgi:hypothetical protein